MKNVLRRLMTCCVLHFHEKMCEQCVGGQKTSPKLSMGETQLSDNW